MELLEDMAVDMKKKLNVLVLLRRQVQSWYSLSCWSSLQKPVYSKFYSITKGRL